MFTLAFRSKRVGLAGQRHMSRVGRQVAVPQDPAEREHVAARGPRLAVPRAGREKLRYGERAAVLAESRDRRRRQTRREQFRRRELAVQRSAAVLPEDQVLGVEALRRLLEVHVAGDGEEGRDQDPVGHRHRRLRC